jgi:hypothetical protein
MEKKEEGLLDNMRFNYNMLMNVVLVHIMPFLALYRVKGSCGNRFFGLHAALAMIYVPVFYVFAATRNTQLLPLVVFMLIYVASLLTHKKKRKEFEAKGIYVHSQSDGWSHIDWIKRWDENKRKGTAEPMFTFFMGFCWLLLGEMAIPLAIYCFIGGIGLAFFYSSLKRECEAQDQAMIDAQWQANRITGFNRRT